MHRYFEINEGGHNIRCKLDLKAIRRIVLFCHGFGGHKDNGAAEKFAEQLTSKYKGTADEIVPIEASRTFAENNLIEFLPIPGADHRFRDSTKMEQAIKHILEFYAL